MSGPYTPTAFASPALNPATGGAGVPIPYVSNAQYAFAPTAMDTGALVPGGSASAQQIALAGVLARASAWADRFCYGADPAAKGSSLAASVSVEAAYLPVTGRELRLVCDYKPILSVLGVDIGADPSNTQSIGSSGAAVLRFGRRTVYVPASVIPTVGSGPLANRVYAVWSYVNGYPHTSLAASVSAGATSLSVAATDGASTVLGVQPGMLLTIQDGATTETVTVTDVSGTTLTITPAAFAHAAPVTPGFTPVTALPGDVIQAVIFYATALIKTRGDNSLVLDGTSEPRTVEQETGDEFTDVSLAKELLSPYRVRMKAPR